MCDHHGGDADLTDDELLAKAETEASQWRAVGHDDLAEIVLRDALAAIGAADVDPHTNQEIP